MSQIEESRQPQDSGRLEARPPRQQLWKYANIHNFVGPPVQIPRATRAKESEVSPGSQLQKPGNQKSTWLLSGRSCKLQQGRGGGEGDAHQGRKKGQKKNGPLQGGWIFIPGRMQATKRFPGQTAAHQAEEPRPVNKPLPHCTPVTGLAASSLDPAAGESKRPSPFRVVSQVFVTWWVLWPLPLLVFKARCLGSSSLRDRS